jgi:hypothetical protein
MKIKTAGIIAAGGQFQRVLVFVVPGFLGYRFS